jgi:hypothetical protein
MEYVKPLGRKDPYFTSEHFTTVGYWKAKWEARQFWFEQNASFEERELQRELKKQKQ